MIMFSSQALSVPFLCLTSGAGPDSLQPRQTFNKILCTGLRDSAFISLRGSKNAAAMLKFVNNSLTNLYDQRSLHKLKEAFPVVNKILAVDNSD